MNILDREAMDILTLNLVYGTHAQQENDLQQTGSVPYIGESTFFSFILNHCTFSTLCCI